MMWDAAAAKIARAGRQHPHGHAARQPALGRATPGSGPSRRTTADGETKTFTARHVISSAPIRELMREHRARRRPACGRAQTLRYRDFLTVALIVDKPDLFPDNWIYIHEPSVKVGRIQNFRSWSPEMVPDANSPASASNISASRATACGRRPTSELIALAKKELAKIGLCTRGRRHRRLRRAPEEGLSGLRRELQGQRRRRSASELDANVSRRCTSSAATACTSTTTRTTR